MELGLVYIIILISISCFVSFTIALNRYAINKQNSINMLSIVYISEALISSISGFLLGLAFTSFSKNIILAVVASAIGAFLGKKTLNILSKFVLIMLKGNVNMGDLNTDMLGDIKTIGDNENHITDNKINNISNQLKELEKIELNVSKIYNDPNERNKALKDIRIMKNELLTKKLELIRSSINKNTTTNVDIIIKDNIDNNYVEIEKDDTIQIIEKLTYPTKEEIDMTHMEIEKDDTVQIVEELTESVEEETNIMNNINSIPSIKIKK